jgi:hypothetical protein
LFNNETFSRSATQRYDTGGYTNQVLFVLIFRNKSRTPFAGQALLFGRGGQRSAQSAARQAPTSCIRDYLQLNPFIAAVRMVALSRVCHGAAAQWNKVTNMGPYKATLAICLAGGQLDRIRASLLHHVNHCTIRAWPRHVRNTFLARPHSSTSSSNGISCKSTSISSYAPKSPSSSSSISSSSSAPSSSSRHSTSGIWS